MSGSTTMTVRLSRGIKKQLGQLAKTTDRTKSWLAARAIADYVVRENEIVAGIKRGIADARAGRLIPHDKVVARLRATAGKAKRRKR